MEASLERIVKRIAGIYLAAGEKEELGQRQERYSPPDGSDPRFGSIQEIVDSVLEADAAVARWILLSQNSPYKKRYQSDTATVINNGEEIPEACVGCKSVLIKNTPKEDYICGTRASSLRQLQKYQKANRLGYYFISCGRAYFSGESMQVFASEYAPDYSTESNITLSDGTIVSVKGTLQAPQVYEEVVLAYAIALLFKDGADTSISSHWNVIWQNGRQEILRY